MSFSLYRSFTTTVSELSRGSSTGGSSGKGHVKSASVSSPGSSAADSSTTCAQQSDSLGARYKPTHTKIIDSTKIFWTVSWLPADNLKCLQQKQIIRSQNLRNFYDFSKYFEMWINGPFKLWKLNSNNHMISFFTSIGRKVV